MLVLNVVNSVLQDKKVIDNHPPPKKQKHLAQNQNGHLHFNLIGTETMTSGAAFPTPAPPDDDKHAWKRKKKITEQHVPFELCHTQFPFQGLRGFTEPWPHNSLSLPLCPSPSLSFSLVTVYLLYFRCHQIISINRSICVLYLCSLMASPQSSDLITVGWGEQKRDPSLQTTSPDPLSLLAPTPRLSKKEGNQNASHTIRPPSIHSSSSSPEQNNPLGLWSWPPLLLNHSLPPTPLPRPALNTPPFPQLFL